MKKKVAVFDFDGTLTLTDTTKFLLFSLLVYKPFLIWKVIDLFAGKKDSLYFQNKKNDLIGMLIADYTCDKLNRSLLIYRFLIKRVLRKNVCSILNEYVNNGDLTIIATASPTFVFKNIFCDSVIIGTEFIIESGRYSGQRNEEHCYGKSKADKVINYLEANDIKEIDTAYSDHKSDLPLLCMAKNPFFVKNHELIKLDNADVREIPYDK